MNQPRMERRIGHRKPVVGLRCRWDLTGVGQKKRLLRRPAEQYGDVLELSVSGALIAAPASDLLVPGTVVSIDVEGQHGGVAIRNVRPAAVDGHHHYGVEFLQLDAGLRAQINEFIASDRPGHLEAVWHKSR
ncbi:MAG: PilZ domain-containing protein [Actinomycetes bacterium]